MQPLLSIAGDSWVNWVVQPVEVAKAAILQSWGHRLRDATQEVDRAGARGCHAERAAWALAVRLTNRDRSYRGPGYMEYLNRANVSAENAKLEDLIRFSDFTWSVACERFGDGWDAHGAGVAGVRAEADRNFEVLFTLHSSWLIAQVASMVRSARDADAEGIAADAWLAMHERYWTDTAPDRFLALCSIRTKLRMIARGRASDLIKRRRQQFERSDEYWDEVSSDAGTEAAAQFRSTLRTFGESLEDRLQAAIEHQPPGRRVILFLVLFRGLKPSEVAASLGCSRPNVTQQLTAGLRDLHERMST